MKDPSHSSTRGNVSPHRGEAAEPARRMRNRAEAAAWVARLHGPNRTPEAEAGLRRWMAEDPERAAAFELLTDTWEKSARLRRRPFERMASWELPGFRVTFSRAAVATAAVAMVAVIGTALYLRSDGLATGIGEQRTLTLEDGTRVHLNTDTRIAQHYDKQARHVELEHGEAFFEVAKRPDWPFIVTAGDKQVRALGTAFVVRRDEGNLAITLVEGKVTVAPVGFRGALQTKPPSSSAEREDEPSPLTPLPSRAEKEVIAPGVGDDASRATGSRSKQHHGNAQSQPVSALEERAGVLTRTRGEVPEATEVLLSAGERLIFVGTAAPTLDKPSIDRVTAWQRGQVVFDSTPLADAIAEMNRYTKTRLVIADSSIATIPISGIFRAGDSESLAQAVAKTYGLQVRDESNAIVLAAVN